MKCSFESDGLISCSGYKLNITHAEADSLKEYICIFERSHHSPSCECKIKVQGFVTSEMFTTTLLEGTNVLLSKTFTTRDFIKPKTPVLSVQKTENGNFKVTWDDKYTGYSAGNFKKSLEIHLSYRIKGEDETKSENVSNSVGFFEIVGINLQPNTDYILTARMSTNYNGHKILSDQSAPVEFTSSSSPNEMVRTLVPLLCVGLVVFICALFICVLRMKTKWWDKISKPKVNASFGEEKGHILPPSTMNFSTIHVEIPKLEFQEKKLISASSVDTTNEKSSHSVESAAGDYGQAGFDSGSDKENCSPINVSSRIKHALEEDFKSLFTSNTPSNQGTTMLVKSVGISSSREHNRANRDSGNCSGSSVFSNMTYLESATDDSSFLEQLSCDHSCQSDKRENSSMSADISKSKFNFPTIDALEDGYQCFNSVVNQGNDADVSLNLSDDADSDEKLIVKNLITSKNPLYPSLLPHDGSVTPSDNGYQAFEGLTKSTEGQWSTSIRTEQALNECGALKFPHSTGQDPTSTAPQSLWASSLHFSPIIQIDTSYQSV
ncbi:Interleukin-4 receptor subunit alpha [Anabarilius grahami]|uniref:Interleukin-4 receptor subunit alpha n=1 Tax=Anabarilius grahami TaxID=495550 RepID=A0A3N0Y8V4_ANAGA|nr:Interleukin-4 receptor subunit alpha [Anabarilius grahami]